MVIFIRNRIGVTGIMHLLCQRADINIGEIHLRGEIIASKMCREKNSQC